VKALVTACLSLLVCVCVCIYITRSLLLIWLFRLSHFFHILLVLFCIIVYMVVCFYMLLFIFVYYVFLLLCMFRSGYSVSLCCSVYCVCVNVYSTTATRCQPKCSYIYRYINKQSVRQPSSQ